jgi:cobalamin biosynthesis protein CbiG
MLVLGVGIEPGTPLAHLREAVDALGLAGFAVVATIDRRADEPAVLALAAGRALRTYPAAVLDAVDVPHPSAVVRRLIGTGSVAEAAAVLAAREVGEGELVTPKRRGRGVTVAVAR